MGSSIEQVIAARDLIREMTVINLMQNTLSKALDVGNSSEGEQYSSWGQTHKTFQISKAMSAPIRARPVILSPDTFFVEVLISVIELFRLLR